MGKEGWRGLVAGQVDAQASLQYEHLSSNDKRMRQGIDFKSHGAASIMARSWEGGMSP